MIHHAFTTPILREENALPATELSAIRDYLLEVRRSTPGDQRSNRGGWHSSGNLFEAKEHRQFPALRDAVTQALFRYIGETFGYRGAIQLALTAWAVVNGPADYNVPHNHARNLLSGVLYVSVPEGMRGGEIVFQDPRLNLNAYGSEAMRELKLVPPWEEMTVTVFPKSGDLLIFPSWLMHYVQNYTAPGTDPQRIVISFNAAV